MLKRITKAQARKRFAANEPVYLCPVKLRPGFPWNPATLIMGADWRDWNEMYNNWHYYNASNETGYYASYWEEV